MIYGIDKPIYELRYGGHVHGSLTKEEILESLWATPEEARYNSPTKEFMYLGSKADLYKIVKSKSASLKKGSTLYFGKTSKFPRFKLASTSDYKRCIKLDKADFVVLGNDIPIDYSGSYCIVIEDDKNVYFISSDYYLNSIRVEPYSERKKFETDPLNFLLDNQLFYGTNPKVIHKGNYSAFYGKNVVFDVENILNGNYTNIILDSDVDAEINKVLPTLTEEDVNSINDLFNSSDTASQELGLKLLTGFNVEATPVTVRTLIGQYEKLRWLNAWNSVGVQQVLSSIKWTGFISFPTYIYNALQWTEEQGTAPYSEEDLNLCRKLYARAAATVMDAAVKRIAESGMNKMFNFNIKYEIS